VEVCGSVLDLGFLLLNLGLFRLLAIHNGYMFLFCSRGCCFVFVEFFFFRTVSYYLSFIVDVVLCLFLLLLRS